MEQNFDPTLQPNLPETPMQRDPIINKGLIIALVITVVLVGGYFVLAKYQSWWPFTDAAFSACSKFSDPLERSHCYTDLSIKSNNSDLCKKIDGNKDGCYRSVGEALKDISVCNKIQGSRAKEYCILHVSGSGGLVPETAVKKGNCANPDIEAQDYCYADDAFTFEDPTLCEKVQDPAKKDDCYAPMTVALASNIENTCGKIQDIEKKERCYGGVAQAKRDFKICDMINNEGVKNECYRSVSYEIGYREGISKCSNVQNQNLKDICSNAAKDREANP
ncbi:MAG: hypothetical protein AAB641_00810 [Patescibacteria group bacterium]